MKGLLGLVGRSRFGRLERGYRYILLHMDAEIFHRSLGQLIHVEQKAGRRIKKNGAKRLACAGQQLLVDLHHRDRQLTRPHQGDYAPL